jgi:hypothetical protein
MVNYMTDWTIFCYFSLVISGIYQFPWTFRSQPHSSIIEGMAIKLA